MTGSQHSSCWCESGLMLRLVVGVCASIVVVTAGCEQAKLPAASVGNGRATVGTRTASHETSVIPVSDTSQTAVGQETKNLADNADVAAGGAEPVAAVTDTGAEKSAAVDAAPAEATAAPTEPIADQPAKPAADTANAKPTKSNEPRECTFDTVKFNMEKGDPFHRKLLTSQIEALDGQRIRIRGYMLPTSYQKGLTEFVLVRDNMKCCFGPGAALFDCMYVQFEPGKTTDFSIRPVAVEGVFSIQVLPGPDGYPLAIYHLLASDVR